MLIHPPRITTEPLERSHTEQQHDDFYSLVAKAEEDALKKYLSIRM